MRGNHIGQQAAVPAITIGKTMNAYNSVFDPDRYFIRHKYFIMGPE